MSFIKEFREFAMRGNVVDMAVGVIIGGAFGKIVSSLVSDIFMMIKMIKKVRKPEEKKPAGPTEEEKLLTEIRDLLKEKQ